MKASPPSIICALSALLCLCATAGQCATGAIGETAGSLPSVRANAMGDAYTAASGDVFGTYYNPAHISTRTIGAAFERGYAEDSGGVISAFMPRAIGEFNIGASLLYYTAGDMELYGPNGRMGEVNAQRDYMGTLTVSRSFRRLSLGVNAKGLRTKLFDSKSGNAFLFDAGALWRGRLISLGAALQNIGTKLSAGSEDEKIPWTVRFGAQRGFKLGEVDLTLGADYVRTEREPGYVSAALELLFGKTLAVRGGYEFKNKLAEANEPRFGFGVNMDDFSVDYALVPYKDLGTTHRFALTYRIPPDSNR